MSVTGANLLSLHGHLLAYDVALDSVVGTADHDCDSLLYVDILDNKSLFYIKSAGRNIYITFGAQFGLNQTPQTSSFLVPHWDGQMFCRFETACLFLSANPEGSCDFKIWKEIYEKFFVVRSDSLAQRLLSDMWFSWAARAPCRPRLKPNYCLSLGEHAIELPKLETHGFCHNNDIIAIYADYCVERLSKYRPLVYLTAFGDDSAYIALKFCLESISLFGDYDGYFLIIADRPEDSVLAIVPEIFKARTVIKHFAAFDVIDYVNARFVFPELEEFAAFQPVIYIDIDIICTAPLAPLLATALLTNSILLRYEGDIDLIHYGNELTKRDRFPRLQKRLGFNSGVIAFRSLEQARLPFGAARASLKCHLQAGLDRRSSEAFDQPVANYVFNAIAHFDVEVLAAYVHPCLPTMDDTMDAPGLVHFFGGVGAAHKIKRMERFLERLVKEK